MSTDRNYFGPSEGMQFAVLDSLPGPQLFPKPYVGDGSFLLTIDDYPPGSTNALYGKAQAKVPWVAPHPIPPNCLSKGMFDLMHELPTDGLTIEIAETPTSYHIFWDDLIALNLHQLMSLAGIEDEAVEVKVKVAVTPIAISVKRRG
jgi:hypothetical protein